MESRRNHHHFDSFFSCEGIFCGYFNQNSVLAYQIFDNASFYLHFEETDLTRMLSNYENLWTPRGLKNLKPDKILILEN